MRKIWIIGAALLVLPACGLLQEEKDPADLENLLSRYQDAAIQAKVVITENLGEGIQAYTITFERKAGEQDHITILQPENVAGITFTVAADQSASITYQDTVLQTALSQLSGVTPADAVSVLLQELSERLPAESWTEKTENGDWLAVAITDTQAGKAIRKDVFLEPQDGAIGHADIYVDGECLLQLDFEDFTWIT